MQKGDDHERLGPDLRALRFECPRLAEGVSWLGAQLGVLYGEGNGRFFAVAAVKEAVLRMGYHLTVGVGDGFVGGRDGQAGANGGAAEKGSDAGVLWQALFSSPRLLPPSLRCMRGFPWRRRSSHCVLHALQNISFYLTCLFLCSSEKESGRAKTKEDLLAEERDYKRRRQSYRGKKTKRNTTEILRDIIDEHMEEIKLAGGIGCLVGAPDDIVQNMLKSNSRGDTYQGNSDATDSSSYDKAALGSWSPSCENLPHADSLGRVSSRSHGKRDSYKSMRYETHGSRYQNLSDHENRWNKESERESDQSYLNHNDSRRHRRNSNDDRKYAYKHKNDTSEDSYYRFEPNDCTTRSTRSQRSSVTEYEHMLGAHSNRSRTSQKRHSSVSVTQDEFSDRYDPQSTYSNEDPPTNMLCDVTEGKREMYHDEVHRHGHHERKRDHHC
ncbi:hypothetical protein EJB05_37208 [Eragrostis curvula]|uniref:Uncharacterized protein n=1 Tax=Eragrostis curvula TaxID=38414 RepID=A0A5J9TR11_9POAL|nr:hypothetical protein EJB05_37208 [Eragrostis curvula]